MLLIQAILLYPKIILLLSARLDYKKQNVGHFSFSEKNQTKPFKDMLDHDLLMKETHLYGFLAICTEEENQILNKLIEIYVERSSSLWKSQ